MSVATVQQLTDPRQIQALTQPVRVQVLDALREPDSAAGVARTVGRTRQNVNYHLKELARVGLVRHAGERRKGNFVEQLYQSIARRFVVSARFAWDPERLDAALRDQMSLARLAELGEHLHRDAAALLDQAAFTGTDIPSATIDAEIRFADETARRAFMRDYLAAMKPLLARYGTGEGQPYRVALAAYPRLTEQEES